MAQSITRLGRQRSWAIRGWLKAAVSTMALWVERRGSRRALAALEEDPLRDVGLTRAAPRRESAKPIWMP